MKKRSIVFPLFLLTLTAFAREPALEPIDEPVLKKNEVSINIVPVLKVLMNAGISPSTRFSATYKRLLTDRSALRFSIMSDLVNNDAHRYAPWMHRSF